MNTDQTHPLSKAVIEGFLQAAASYPDRPALDVEDQRYTYRQLALKAAGLAGAIGEQPFQHDLVAFLANRSITAYAAIAGILMAGKGYVPLNPKFPKERSTNMYRQSGCKMLIVGRECLPYLPEFLEALDQPVTLLLPEVEDPDDLPAIPGQYTLIIAGDLTTPEKLPATPEVDPRSTAYLLFTSGSTGAPKGIPVPHDNLRSFVAYICRRYDFTPDDRFSQAYDLTFDPSVWDMFVCWQSGACLCVVPPASVMAPAKFIKDKELTVWSSAPSVPIFTAKLKLLKPGAFPDLRYSFFCAEPLPVSITRQWQLAAPNSIIENLYGLTETTIVNTHYRWDPENSESKNNIVPIGQVFYNHRYCIVNEDMKPVEPGISGELCLSGPQITRGYWKDPEKTREQYIAIPGQGERIWFKTGDVVQEDDAGCLYFLGRVDQQVKIRGFRVELQEIEWVLRQATRSDAVMAVPWPVKEGIADGIVAYISGVPGDRESEILTYCQEKLPDYMVPKRIFFLEELPLNVNGKYDRKLLTQQLEEGI